MHDQIEWATSVRMRGLLLIIDYVARKMKKAGASIPGDLARSYISKIARPKRENTIQEPLLLLVEIGILDSVRPSVFGPHIKSPGVFRIHADYDTKVQNLTILLPKKLREKCEQADGRKERRLNRRYPFRARLLDDLKRLSLSQEARKIIAVLQRDGRKSSAIQSLTQILDGALHHFANVNERGQITTSIGSLPTELKDQLLIDGEKAAFSDISHAHYCILPALITGRMQYLKNKGASAQVIADYELERAQLRDFLGSGDFYRKLCRDPENEAERAEKKELLLVILNWPNQRCERNGLYQKLRRMFPLTWRIIEDLKRSDHRTIAKQLQSLTARAIERALIELQRQGILVIPHVDALLSQEKSRIWVCEALGRAVYGISGVCAKVGGIRYNPDGSTSGNQPKQLATGCLKVQYCLAQADPQVCG